MKVEKNVFYTIVLILISLALFIILKSTIYSSNFIFVLKIISWLCNIIFIYGFFSIYVKEKNIFGMNIIFYVLFFLFSFGQVFLFSIGSNTKNIFIFNASSNIEILNATIYFYFCLLFYILGCLIVLNRKRELLKDYTSTIKSIDKYDNAVLICGILFLVISFFSFFYNYINNLKNSLLYGYNFLYNNNMELSGIVGYLETFFVPGILAIMYGLRKRKIFIRIIIILLLLLSFGYLLIGTRNGFIRIIIIIIVFYNLFIKKIEKKDIVKLIPFGILIVILIPFFASYRGTSNKSINTFTSSFISSIISEENSFVFQTIHEVGYTMYPTILTSRIIPRTTNYKYGQSYVASALMLIPSFMFYNYSFSNMANLDTWLQKSSNLSYGPGFSIPAETYYNFGWYGGAIFVAFISMFFTSIFNLDSKKDISKNQLLKIISLIFFFTSIVRARFPFHSTLRNLVYICFVMYILVLLIYKKQKGK